MPPSKSSPYSQHQFNVRTEVGENGLKELDMISDVVIIVDILSFTTCVSIACENGATIFPFRWKDERAADFAKSINADLADRRGSDSRFQLSPISLQGAGRGDRIVLPSPNGSQLSKESRCKNLLAGSFRNAKAVAVKAQSLGKTISIIQTGERWISNNEIRHCFEDQIGAGAIISFLTGEKSPEALAAEAVFLANRTNLEFLLLNCSSGIELAERGFREDILLASKLNVSNDTAMLMNSEYFSSTT